MLKPLIFALIFTLVPLASQADDKAEQRQKLEAGEVLIKTKSLKGGVSVVRMMGLIKAPMTKIWSLIEDCNKYTKTMLRLKEAKELSRNGNQITCKTVLAMPFPVKDLTAVTVATHTVKPGKEYKRAWKLVKGDFRVNTGSWQLKPYKDGRTLVIYKAKAAPTVDVPDVLRSAAQKKTLPKLFRHIQKQAEGK